jgi:hypothetical protein
MPFCWWTLPSAPARNSCDDTGRTVPGLPRAEALLLAARVRLRPILMTTLAMIFGMVPLAFALSEGSEQRAPMGQAVIGGVITSSLLTLVVVPVVYCYMDDLALKIGGRLVAIVGEEPIMHAQVITRTSESNFKSDEKWDDNAPRLLNFPQASAFKF